VLFAQDPRSIVASRPPSGDLSLGTIIIGEADRSFKLAESGSAEKKSPLFEGLTGFLNHWSYASFLLCFHFNGAERKKSSEVADVPRPPPNGIVFMTFLYRQKTLA